MALNILDRISRKLNELSDSAFSNELNSDASDSTVPPVVDKQLKAITDKMKTMHELLSDFHDLYLIFHRNLENHQKSSYANNAHQTTDPRKCTTSIETQIFANQPPIAAVQPSMNTPITAVDLQPVVQQNSPQMTMTSSEGGSSSKCHSAAEVLTSSDDTITREGLVDGPPVNDKEPADESVNGISMPETCRNSHKRDINNSMQTTQPECSGPQDSGRRLRHPDKRSPVTNRKPKEQSKFDEVVHDITIVPMEVAVCRLEDARVNAHIAVPVHETTEQSTFTQDKEESLDGSSTVPTGASQLLAPLGIIPKRPTLETSLTKTASETEISSTTEDVQNQEVICETDLNASVCVRRSTRIRKVSDKMKSNDAMKSLLQNKSPRRSSPRTRKQSLSTITASFDDPESPDLEQIKVERTDSMISDIGQNVATTCMSHQQPVDAVGIKQENMQKVHKGICPPMKTYSIFDSVKNVMAIIEDEICADVFSHDRADDDEDDLNFVEEVITLSDGNDYCSSSDGEDAERCITFEHRYSKNLCRHYHRQVAMSDADVLEDHPVNRDTRCSRNVPYHFAVNYRRQRREAMKSVTTAAVQKRVPICIGIVEVSTSVATPVKRKREQRLSDASQLRRRRKQKRRSESASDNDDGDDEHDFDDDVDEDISSPSRSRNSVATAVVSSLQIVNNAATNKPTTVVSRPRRQRNPVSKVLHTSKQPIPPRRVETNLEDSARAGTSCKSPTAPRMRTLCLRLCDVHDLYAIWEIMRDFVQNEKSVLLKFPANVLQRKLIVTLCRVCNFNFKVNKHQVIVVKHRSTPPVTVVHLHKAVRTYESQMRRKRKRKIL